MTSEERKSYNQRYYQSRKKVKDSLETKPSLSVVSPQNTDFKAFETLKTRLKLISNTWIEILLQFMERPRAVGYFVVSLVVGFLMISFQHEFYVSINSGSARLTAVLVEAMLFVTGFFVFTGKDRFEFWFSKFLWVLTFSYVLCSISYTTIQTAGDDVLDLDRTNSGLIELNQTIQENQVSLKIAQDKKESGNISKYSKALIDARFKKSKLDLSGSAAHYQIHFLALGTITLRGLVMLFGAFMAGCCSREMRRSR